MNALRPAWFASLLFLCQALCKAPILQRAFCAIFPLFTHVITLTTLAVVLLSHRFPSAMVGPRRKAKRAWMLVITVSLHCICIFHEACRSFPRVTREHYTRTKVRQRRVFQTTRSPTKTVTRKFTRRDRLRAKAQPKAAKARIANIISCLAKDAADSKRKRLGLAPDESLPTPEEQHHTKERSWRNPIADSLRSPKLSSWAALLIKVVTLSLLMSSIVSILALPVAMGTGATSAAVEMAANNGYTNFAAAEVQAQQKEDLARLKLQPHKAEEIFDQFSHGINAHVPDGVRTKVDPEEYWKDPQTKLMMHRLPHLTNDQFQSLVHVLQQHADAVVAYKLTQITGYRGFEPPLTIDLDTDKPIFQPPRRNFSQAEKEISDEKCDDLIASGVVVEVKHSNYACNAVLAAKRAPNGTWSDKRFCINFIPINKHTELDRYGSHRAEDLFHKVTKAKYLTALDLRSGFHQIPIKEEDRCKASFWWVSARNQPPKLLAYQRMPFGLKNAPAKFQRVMDTELTRSGCAEFAFAYIDDLLIASDTWEEHVMHVDKVLRMLISCDLRIHPDKSVFGTNIVEYLGHNVVGEHGITMNESKVEAIKVLPDPNNVSELRSILGFLSYYRHFIPGFSSIVAPMTKLLQKEEPWRWTAEQADSYTAIKKVMTTYGRVLRRIDPNRELILHTDWSNHGIGAVLGQKDDDGNEYLCGCVSRSLNKHEKNYPSYKGELLALAWAVRSYRTHVHGTKFQLFTDHQPLTWLMKARDLTGQYSRWQMMLQEYDFVINHRPGAKHQNADVLSRFPCKTTEDRTGARMDVELVAAAIRREAELDAELSAWMCPYHGPDCPGQPTITSSTSVTSCPEHGPTCHSKSCAKLLEAQYTWDASASKWKDPNESRDTCMECCTEALWEHPLKDETCHYVCHKCHGTTILRPPTPPKSLKSAMKPSTVAVTGGCSKPIPPIYTGRIYNLREQPIPQKAVSFVTEPDATHDHPPPNAIGRVPDLMKERLVSKTITDRMVTYPYKGTVTGTRGHLWEWDKDYMPEGTTEDECVEKCYTCGMEALAPRLGKAAADDYVRGACRHNCTLEPIIFPPPKTSKPASNIDSFAPPFSDFIDANNSGFLGRDCYMNNGLRQAYEPESEDAGLGEHSRVEQHNEAAKIVASICTATKEQIIASLPEALAKAAANLSNPSDPADAKLDQGVVASSFFKNAASDGITLVELCAGIGAGLESALLSGMKINKYVYVDIDPLARDIARFRIANLSAQFPKLFPPTAWEQAFDLPQDINAVRDYHIDHHLADKRRQILLIAGWPCQEYSPAGKGIPGPRAAILDKVISILVRLQSLQPEHPIAYLLENVAIQENFIHEHIKNEVAAEVDSKIGKPVTFDAANVGSYATRVRNYWTNLAGAKPMQMVYNNLKCPRKGNLYTILGKDRHPMPVEAPSKGGHNVPGEVRATFPTLMSFRQSRAFRPMRAGSIYASKLSKYVEPDAVERELAMGYEAGSTAAPEVDDGDRCSALGQAIDLNALFSLFQVAHQLHRNGLSHVGSPKREPNSRARKSVMAFRLAAPREFGHGDCDDDAHLNRTQIVAFIGNIPTDVWDDDEVITFLQHKVLPASSIDSKRVMRRAKAYRFFNNRLFKVIEKQGEPLSYRSVPKPDARDRIILESHQDLGHLGKKRSISALSATYWWYGMTVDIKRIISGCKQCQRVKASGGHEQRDMQTESPESYGLFHRWGLDHIVELPTSANGFKHALVCIDYYSKWIEVIPVKDLTAETTVQAFLMHVIARFGTPAEIITDNGTAFKNEFRDFCRRRLIHQRFITEDVPRSNGLAERAVQTVKNALRKFAALKHHALDWDTSGLPAILTGYRMTPQAASKHSPARIVFALDPILDAEQHLCRMGNLDYEDPSPERVDKELWKRVRYVQELSPQVSHNLRTAHERDCRRFKARRSGLYIPRLHHFAEGDYVFIREQGQKPGGTLGTRARAEVLRVTQVRDSGVLVLINQAGQVIDKHMEHCVPCTLPNLLGDTYAGLTRPPEDLPCQVCNDHRHWDLMLLCDNCDTGWHTFCLSPALDVIPEGDWLCPDCTTHGMTHERLAEKRERYKEDERSRPALEMPGRSRQAKAQAMADEWHNTVVKHMHHGKLRFGRVRFQGILNPNWFRIDWQNGSSSEHMGRIFANLEPVDEADAPHNVPSPLDPVVVAASRRIAAPTATPTSHPWRRATIAEMGLTDEDWITLSRMFRKEVLQSMIFPILQDYRWDGRREAEFQRNLSCGGSARKALNDGALSLPSWETESAVSGLRNLLSSAKSDVIFVSSLPELTLATMPVAAEYAKAVVITKLTPTMQHLLMTGKLDHLRWLYYHKGSSNLLVHHVFDSNQVRVATWLYLFPRNQRSKFLKPDVHYTCSLIASDHKTGDITAMI
jgi:transposase InsO family protein